MKDKHSRPLGIFRFSLALAERLSAGVFFTLAMLTLQHHEAKAQQSETPQVVQLPDEWSKDASAIDRFLSDRQCDKAWDLLLKHIKMGNQQAFVKTAGAIGAIHGPGLRLPGAPTDALSTMRITTSFAALALDGEHAQAARNFLALLTIFRSPCGEGFDAAACHKYVLERNIVPPLDVFLKEIASYQSAAKAGALCIGPPPP